MIVVNFDEANVCGYNIIHYNVTYTKMRCVVSESEPVCRTNVSHPQNAVNASDHIEIVCSVSFSGIWTPVFVCVPELSRITDKTLPNHVLYRSVVAVADIEDFAVFNCSMTFTVAPNYRTMVFLPTELQNPIYDFTWKTSAIRIVNASGE